MTRFDVRFYARLVALRTARDLYVAFAVALLNGSAWLGRRRPRA